MARLSLWDVVARLRSPTKVRFIFRLFPDDRDISNLCVWLAVYEMLSNSVKSFRACCSTQMAKLGLKTIVARLKSPRKYSAYGFATGKKVSSKKNVREWIAIHMFSDNNNMQFSACHYHWLVHIDFYEFVARLSRWRKYIAYGLATCGWNIIETSFCIGLSLHYH